MGHIMANSDHNKALSDDGAMFTLSKCYENFQLFDAQRNAFIHDLFSRYQYVSERLMQERTNFDRERQQAHALQNSLQGHLHRNPFVLVLMDGADLLFRNNFLRDGDAGGRRCASMLQEAVHEYVFSAINNLPSETKVLVHLYADLEDLADTCVSSGVVDQRVKVRGFARGFVQEKVFFDIINVYGKGRETIIDKVEAQLQHHLYNVQCRHIILGCSDNAIYKPILEQAAKDRICHERITLLSGLPLDKGLAELPYKVTRMTHIFRNTKVEVHQFVDHIQEPETVPTIILSSPAVNPLGVVTPPLSTPSLSIRSESRLGEVELHNRSEASSVVSMGARAPTPAPARFTWASAAGKASSLPLTISDKLLKKTQEKYSVVAGIRRNKYGQRLDPPAPEYNKEEVHRVAKLQLCNTHHLRGCCTHDDAECPHDHRRKCSKSELETLRLIARMSPCVHDTDCSDEECLYSHNCPLPAARGGEKHGKGCLYGESCKFPLHMHNQDKTAVKTISIK